MDDEEQVYKEKAQWAADALANVTLVGSQAGNYLAVSQFLAAIASGELVVSKKGSDTA